MRVRFRIKLLAVVAIAGLALMVLVAVGQVTAQRVDDQIVRIQKHQIPLIGLRPRLQSQLDRLTRGFKDAVAASDLDLLSGTHDAERQFLDQLGAARGAVDATEAATLAHDLQDYYESAYDVSRRLIQGETGEAIVSGMADMQRLRARAAAQLDKVTTFEPAELTRGFDSVVHAQRTAVKVRLVVSVLCLLGVIVLSLWINRGVLRSLSDLTDGLARFADGEFGSRIPVSTKDELGDVSRRANEMADALARMRAERDRVDWVRSGQVGLTAVKRGVLSPPEVAERALGFLCRYLDAPVAALYYLDDPDGLLQLLGSYGVAGEVGTRGAPASFRLGEGLVGQAALASDLTVIDRVPPGELAVRSGLVDGTPASLALVPLLHQGRVVGVMELGRFSPWPEQALELLASVREPLAKTIEVARGTAATSALLAETQRQAASLAATRRSLEQKARELAAASAYKSQFLANMSHELRTPLNAIIGFAELMVDGAVPPDSPEHNEFLGDILLSGRHLLKLINDVLDLSKVEAGKIEFRPEDIQLDQLVAEVLAILRTAAAGRRVRIESQIDPSLTDLRLDPARLKQVLYNYLSNAIKFTPEGGRITIRALPQGDDQVRVEVEDTGVGIAPADLAQLFVEFKQIHHDGEARGGTGLGLALTRRLVEAQGGTVGARSTVGQGSTFHAVLPRRAAPSSPAAPAALPTMPDAGSGAPSILVVEDDPGDQRQLVAALGQAGYAVELAATGAQAVARCRERRFDAITLDLLLPDMSGLEVLQKVRDTEENHDVPVIVITVVAERGALAGFAVHDILPKPLANGELLSSLQRAEVSPHRDGPVLVVDDDPGSLRLMAATLERLGYKTRCEQDGAAALDAARETPPSAVVLDLCMPNMDGFEFLDRLRSEESGRCVPVIVWTVKDLSPHEHDRLRRSAQAVINKGRGGSSGVVAELTGLLSPAPEEEGSRGG